MFKYTVLNRNVFQSLSCLFPNRIATSLVRQQRLGNMASSKLIDPTLPLQGFRVLDLTRVLAGPYCTQLLGDLGAEVIKVEHPTRGDDTRQWGPPFAAYQEGSGRLGPGESAYFLAVNRNKKSLALSFKHEAGVKILQKLASESDILVENYLPNTLKKYGLDYTTLQKINPRLIYASITGYGQTGPYRSRAGYDVMVEAGFGLMHITGPKNGPPVKVGVAVTDLTTGLYASNSIMAAIIVRAKTGMGQYIDLALSDCQVATLSNIASSCLISGENDDGRWGTAHPSIVPYRSFKTKDGEILLGGGNNHLFGLICDGIKQPELKTDCRFIDNVSRVTNRYELESIIESVTLTETTRYWLNLFEGSGLPCSEIRDIKNTLSNEHVLARGMIEEIEHNFCGPIKLLNIPMKFSQSRPRIRSAPPILGEHTVSVLKDVLGFKDEEIAELKKVGAIK
ncbi:Succinate--hydroxymethylglutarate CoA-transferase [Erysiphe necator]|nr:Succinate--hydroxymethylglutarate CoA-transferase [Erysiphe necator]